MFKFIKGLFVSEPEAPAPENLVLFTPNDGSWDPKQDAGTAQLLVGPASSANSVQMKVQCSTRATSLELDR